MRFSRNRARIRLTPRRSSPPERIWIDVGAHHGERSLAAAARDRRLLVYAFEPNLSLAVSLAGRLPNYVAIPCAIAQEPGVATLRVLTNDAASSLLPVDKEGLNAWPTEAELDVASTATVPTMRLDTFMRAAGVKKVDWLKIDAQGADLDVLRSAGEALSLVERLEVEAATDRPLYTGGATSAEVIRFCRSRGFQLVGAAPQTDGAEVNLSFRQARQVSTPTPVDAIKSPMARALLDLKTGGSPRRLRIKQALQLAAPMVPVPVRLPFGGWWLAQADVLGDRVAGGTFEPDETMVVSALLQRGMTFLDIGAHAGYYSLLASRFVGHSGRVIACEPSERERRRLLRHVRLNAGRNVVVVPAAVGAHSGTADLHVHTGHETGLNSLKPAPNAPGRVVKVPVVTVDELVANEALARVDFMKVDVEGGELDVLRGAEDLLSRPDAPLVLLEVDDRRTQAWGYPARVLVSLLEAKGYAVFQIEGGGVLRPAVCAEDMATNVLAVPSGRLGGVDHLIAQANHPGT